MRGQEPARKTAMIVRLLRKSRRKPAGRLPEGVRIYAIGDVHGRADLLDRAISRIDAHIAANPVARPILLFVGDYVDRGPGSKDAIDLLIGTARARETVFLRGNHEEFMLNFLSKPALLREWGRVGGLETLMSYGLQPTLNADSATQMELAKALAAALPKEHRQFLTSLFPSFSCGSYFFAHAGVRPGVPLTAQKSEDLLWIRDEFLLYEEDFGKVVIHGHTPVPEIDVRPNRINIDTGAYITGRLSCLVLEKDHFEPL